MAIVLVAGMMSGRKELLEASESNEVLTDVREGENVEQQQLMDSIVTSVNVTFVVTSLVVVSLSATAAVVDHK